MPHLRSLALCHIPKEGWHFEVECIPMLLQDALSGTSSDTRARRNMR